MAELLNRIISPLITIPIIMEQITIGTSYLIEEKNKKEKRIFNFSSTVAESFVKDGKITNNLYNDTIRMSKGDKIIQMNFISKAIETNQWIRFAIYFMTDPLASQISFADKESRELVNGITSLAGFGKVYDSEKIADINLYDSSQLDYDYSGRFLLNKPELIDFLSTPHFQAAMNSKIVKVKQMLKDANIIDEQKCITGEVGRECTKEKQTCANPAFEILGNIDVEKENLFEIHEENPNCIFPIEFGSKERPILPKKGINVPVETYERFEKTFSKFIPETISYHYENINGFYHLYITRPDSGAEEFYIIDDGSIVGGKSVSILANYLSNGFERAMFINVNAHPAITTKILQRTLFNYLTLDEIEECKYDYLYNVEIYNSIDFHNTEFFDQLNATEKYNFEVVLLGVLQIGLLQNIRLRFEEFNDSNHFTLVSDYYMYKPLPYIQNRVMPETYVADGLRVKVDGSAIFVEYNGEVKKFRMGI